MEFLRRGIFEKIPLGIPLKLFNDKNEFYFNKILPQRLPTAKISLLRSKNITVRDSEHSLNLNQFGIRAS